MMLNCTSNFMMASFTMRLFLPFINLDFSFKTKTSCFCMNSMKSIYRQKLSCTSFRANTFYIGIKQVRFHIVNFKFTDGCMQIINIWYNNIVMQMYYIYPVNMKYAKRTVGVYYLQTFYSIKSNTTLPKPCFVQSNTFW
mgnify:CR=1 FL=1